MILVTVGTNPYSFNRLVRSVDEIAGDHKLEVFVQLGNTTYEPKHCAFENFLEKDRLMSLMEKSSLVITHGGFGTIHDALRLGKPVIVVPRKPELGESQDYQEELADELEKEGLVLAVYDICDLDAAIRKAETFCSRGRHSSRIPELISDFVVKKVG